MVSNYYCQICDKHINQRSKKKHINSKTHLYMNDNIIINKLSIGDLYWCDLVETIDKYMIFHLNKFRIFTTAVKCRIANKDINILIDKIEGYNRFFETDDDEEERLYSKYLNRHKMLHYIHYRCGFFDMEINSSTVISDVVITFFSNYMTMTPKHRLFNQPRRILESKLLKHIHAKSNDDKFDKYRFLSIVYNLL